MGEMPFILAQDTERMPPLMLSNGPSEWSHPEPKPSFQLGNAGATEFSSLALDNLNHGCRTQQHRIHEKESREAVSDPEQRRVWFHSCWGDSGWLVGNSLRGSDGEDSLLAGYKLFVQLSSWFHMRGGSKFCPCALQKASLHLPSVSCLKGKKIPWHKAAHVFCSLACRQLFLIREPKPAGSRKFWCCV